MILFANSLWTAKACMNSHYPACAQSLIRALLSIGTFYSIQWFCLRTVCGQRRLCTDSNYPACAQSLIRALLSIETFYSMQWFCLRTVCGQRRPVWIYIILHKPKVSSGCLLFLETFYSTNVSNDPFYGLRRSWSDCASAHHPKVHFRLVGLKWCNIEMKGRNLTRVEIHAFH